MIYCRSGAVEMYIQYTVDLEMYIQYTVDLEMYIQYSVDLGQWKCIYNIL